MLLLFAHAALLGAAPRTAPAVLQAHKMHPENGPEAPLVKQQAGPDNVGRHPLPHPHLKEKLVPAAQPSLPKHKLSRAEKLAIEKAQPRKQTVHAADDDCSETCVYSGDGDCDDGGPGSDFTICALGTDCTDCGHRGGGGTTTSPDSGTTTKTPATDGFCAGHQVYGLLMDAGATVAEGIPRERGEFAEGTVAYVVLLGILFASLVPLFFGQKLATIALVLAAPLSAFTLAFVLFHTWLGGRVGTPITGGVLGHITDATDGYFVPCALPLILAGVIALLVGVVVGCLAAKVPIMTPLIYGFALGFVTMFFLRGIIISAAPAVFTDWAIDWFWLAATFVALITAAISVKCTTGPESNKSFFIIVGSSALGGYGVSQSVIGLVNLKAEKVMPSWSFLIIFLVVALIGVLVQYFATGSDAAANREATRKRLNKGGEEWQQYSDMKKEPLAGP